MTHFITAKVAAVLMTCFSAMSCVSSAENVTKAKGKVTTNGQTVNIKGVDAIYNRSSVTIHYVQGSTYSLRVDEIGQDKSELRREGTTLVIEPVKKKKNNNYTKTIVYLTLPEIKKVKNSGVMDIDASTMESAAMQWDNKGVITVNIDRIRCSGNVSIYNSGVAKWNCTVSADTVSSDISGVMKGTMKFEANTLGIHNMGVGKMELIFKGGSFDIETSGMSTIDANVDCKKLKANNNGIGKMTISGTADDTKIDGSGVSRIDTSELNKL